MPECAISKKNATAPGASAMNPPPTAAGDPNDGSTKIVCKNETAETVIPTATWVFIVGESGDARFLARSRYTEGSIAARTMSATAIHPVTTTTCRVNHDHRDAG